MGVEAVIATQVIDTTSVGRSLMTAADATAARTALSLGTLATQSGTFSGTSSGTNTGDQNLFSTIAVSGQSNVVADQASDTLTLVAGTNITITTDASTDTITITAASGGVTGTGSVDNAALRADGTGGATLQNSNWIIADNATASPNNTVNHASLQATGGTTNVSVSIVPKGTGAFCFAVPDSGTTGGNVRGANAVDMGTSRTVASQVASGTMSRNFSDAGTASGLRAHNIGWQGTASGQDSTNQGNNGIASATATCNNGYYCEANQPYSATIGTGTTASAEGALGLGREANARVEGMIAFATKGSISNRGDKQGFHWLCRNSTTGTTPAILYGDGSSWKLTVPSGKVMMLNIMIAGVKSDGSAVAVYQRQYGLKNVSGTTTQLAAPVTIGTDIASSTSIAISADDTNDCLKIEVTGVAAETWRWQAMITGHELIWSA